MKLTIEQLWNGNISPCENLGEEQEQIKELVGLIARNKKSLEEGLGDDKRQLLEKISIVWKNMKC